MVQGLISGLTVFKKFLCTFKNVKNKNLHLPLLLPAMLKNKILFFLKKKKPVVASFLRKLPFSYTLMRIPKKRILIKDTLSYFQGRGSDKDFFVFEELSRNLFSLPFESASELAAIAGASFIHMAYNYVVLNTALGRWLPAANILGGIADAGKSNLDQQLYLGDLNNRASDREPRHR